MNKKWIVALLIIPVIVLLILNTTFILAASYSKDDSKEKNYIKSSNENDNFEDEIEDDYERDIPITGTSLERASKVALNYIGQGRVTGTEIGDEEGNYEIEITTNNGNQVDVHLDKNFKVISTEWEDDED